MKVLSVINHKGGVGKTTLVIILSRLLGEETRLLVVDLDPQGALTVSFLGRELEDDEQSIENLLLGEKVSPVRIGEKFDLIPSRLSLATIEPKLIGAIGREYKLQRGLRQFFDKGYDLVLIDCPPDLGIFTINAIVASDGILIPVETRFYGIRGLRQLFRVIDEVREYLGKEIDVLGIVPNFFEKNVNLHKEVLQALQKLPYRVFPPIPKRISLSLLSLSGKVETFDDKTEKSVKVIVEEVKKWLRKEK